MTKRTLSLEFPGSGVAGPLGRRRIVDTSVASLDDIADPVTGVTITNSRYIGNSRSLVVLETSLN